MYKLLRYYTAKIGCYVIVYIVPNIRVPCALENVTTYLLIGRNNNRRILKHL